MEMVRDEIGVLIGVTGRRVTQMTAEGKIPKPIKGKYDATAVIRALLNGAKEKREPSPLEKAQARKAEAAAAETEMRLSARRGDLVAVDFATSVFDEFVALVRSELVGFPARITRDVAARRKLEEEIDASLSRIARRCRDAGSVVRSGRDPVDAEAEDDT